MSEKLCLAVLTFVPKHYTFNDINEMNSSLAVILWTKSTILNTFTETIITTVYFMTSIKMNGTV